MQIKTLRNGALALFIALSASAPLAPSAHAQFSKISEQEEIEAGRQSAAQAVKEYGRALPANDARARRVSRIGALFAAQSTRRNIPFSYTVLENDKVLNAFAAPGGPVFVTTKLLSTTANDAELAYVLGHETGHIERKHIVNSVAKQQKVGLGVGILGAILGRGRNSQAASVVGSLAVAGLTSKYSRADEDDADAYGVRTMAKLGFDPRAAVSMLGKLGSGGGGGLSKYLASHPSPESRQNKVNGLIQEDNLLDVARRNGGPRLSFAGNGSDYNAGGATYTSQPFGNGADSNYSNGAGNVISLAAPLRLVPVGNANVVLVSVAEMARYAGGSASADSRNDVVVSRGDSSIRLVLNSNRAVLNGRTVMMSAASRVIDGRFYAPLGSVAAGLGGSATYDASRRAVRVDFDGRGGYLNLP